MGMLAGGVLSSGGTGAPPPELGVVATNLTLWNVRTNNNCYAGVRIDGNNSIYKSDNVGTYTVHNTSYVRNGTTSEVWVERTINGSTGGGLTTDDIGASRLVCSTDRLLEVIDSSDDGSDRSANVTVDFYDASSGGNLLDTATYDLKAEYLGV